MNGNEAEMAELEIIGAPWGNYVRTVRMACLEKGVPYNLTIVRPSAPEVAAIHPFKMVPCMRHGDLALAESRAICTYIDQAFDGRPLVPRDPRGAAITEQWISMVMTTIDPVLARTYLETYLNAPGGVPDPAAIEAVLPKMRKVFSVLDDAFSSRPYLAGEHFNLADMFLFPVIWFMRLKPESAGMLNASPNLMAWYERVAASPIARETEPPPATAPAPACGSITD